jgi:hypothetical protein
MLDSQTDNVDVQLIQTWIGMHILNHLRFLSVSLSKAALCHGTSTSEVVGLFRFKGCIGVGSFLFWYIAEVLTLSDFIVRDNGADVVRAHHRLLCLDSTKFLQGQRLNLTDSQIAPAR